MCPITRLKKSSRTTNAHMIQARGSRRAPPALAHKAGPHVLGVHKSEIIDILSMLALLITNTMREPGYLGQVAEFDSKHAIWETVISQVIRVEDN